MVRFAGSLGVVLAVAVQGWGAAETLLIGRDITACAVSADGAAVYFSVSRNGGEIRRFALSQATPAGPISDEASERVTSGLNPIIFGERMLFVRRGNGKGGLWVRDLATGEERQLRKDPFMGLPPATSADGRVVMAFRWAGKSKRIGNIDLATGKYASLPGLDMSQPALNATGDRLLFVRAGQVWLRDLKTGQDAQLTAGELAYSWPTWSPAGDHVAFCAQAAEGACKVGVLAPSDGKLVWVAGMLEKASCPMFTPDGASLIYLCKTPNGFDTAICRVAIAVP